MKNTHTISTMNTIANTKEGKCLSKVYNGQKSKLEWQCENGHQWKASPNSIIYLNSWCPVCAGNQKLCIEQMKDLAKTKGGKCLSIKYHNSKTKLLWECKQGHQWYATPFSVKNRHSWCPYCCKSY